MNSRIMVIITGQVQGVNFRHYTLETAIRHNVTGWVRNLPDGSVEGCFEGEDQDVNAVVNWCRTGPGWGRVDDVSVQKEEYRGEFGSFEIRR